MLTTAAIFQGADQNIFDGATITSAPAPSTTYTLETFHYQRPDWRVKFGSGTVTISWAVGSPGLRGDILVIPMSNLVDGHVTLTNTTGLSQNIPVPATRRNGLPKTIVVDLSVLTPLAATRTAGSWSLVITSNPANVTIGGAIALYAPKTALGDRDFKWGYTVRKTGAVAERANEYLTRYILDLQAVERQVVLETLATDADADALEAWYDGTHGRGLPGLLWLTPEVEDAFFGVWQPTFERVVGSALCVDTAIVQLTFTELSKGIPLL